LALGLTRQPVTAATLWMVGTLTAHFCMAKALTLADATVVVPIDFLRLPLIALVGYLVYGETLDPYGLLGAMLMLVGNLVNIRAEHRKKHLV
jgi:drug/metabolite transporter (DMT)-like permease